MTPAEENDMKDSNDAHSWAARITDFRENHHLCLAAFARRCGLASSTIYKVVKEGTATDDTARRIDAVLIGPVIREQG